jgi:hypothetical protein
MLAKTLVLLFALCSAMGFSSSPMAASPVAANSSEIVRPVQAPINSGNLDPNKVSFTLSKVECFLTDSDQKFCTITIVNNTSTTYSIGMGSNVEAVSVTGTNSSGHLTYTLFDRSIAPGTNELKGSVNASGKITAVHISEIYASSGGFTDITQYWEADATVDYSVDRFGKNVLIGVGVVLGLLVIVLVAINVKKEPNA